MPHCVLTRYHMLYPLDTPLLYVSLLCVLNIPHSLKYPHYAPSIFLIYSYSWCVWNILFCLCIISFFDGKMICLPILESDFPIDNSYDSVLLRRKASTCGNMWSVWRLMGPVTQLHERLRIHGASQPFL
jgi:hypothetical protein